MHKRIAMAERTADNKYFKFGYEKFGPFLYGFVRWLKKELVQQGYKKVYFFSRDGYMMQKAFDLINDTGIVSRYVYFSRKSLRQPLLYTCDGFEESLQYLSWERYISLGKLLDYYGFNEQEREQLAADGDFLLDKVIPYDDVKKDALARRLYEEHREEINKRSQKQDELLLEYTEQVGMRGRFAIVDIGWRGNMQRFLELYMHKHELEVSFEGFYIGILPNVPLETKTYGYIFNPQEFRKFKEIMCFCGGYEKLLQGFEGSTSGYKRSGETVVPTLMYYEYEADDKVVGAIRAWQDGALYYVKVAKDAACEPTDKKLTSPLIRVGKRPSLADTKLFSFFYNTDGTRVYYTSQKPLYRYRPKELIHALGESPWKTGFMKSVFKIPLPYFTVYKLLRK